MEFYGIAPPPNTTVIGKLGHSDGIFSCMIWADNEPSSQPQTVWIDFQNLAQTYVGPIDQALFFLAQIRPVIAEVVTC